MRETIFTKSDTSATEAQRASAYINEARSLKYKGSVQSRFDRRTRISADSAGRGWVEQDPNMLFKTGDYLFSIPVHGETNDYTVVIKIVDFLTKLNKALETKPFIIPTFQSVLTDAINNNEVQCSCSCPDFTYRSAYSFTLRDNNSGRPESRPAVKTNPQNKPYSCKHILYALNNKLWATKVARNLFNYIVDIWKNKKILFDKIIRPALNDITDEKILSKPEKPTPNPFSPAQQITPAEPSPDGAAQEALNSYYSTRQQYDEDQRLALDVYHNEGADVEIYVTPENSPEQIFALGQALKDGVSPDDIRALSDPELPYRSIEIVAKGLLQHVNLLPYLSFAPNVLEQILRGVQLGVPIEKIALPKFNDRQIEQLIRAYRISPALYETICNPSITYNKMRDIIAGR